MLFPLIRPFQQGLDAVLGFPQGTYLCLQVNRFEQRFQTMAQGRHEFLIHARQQACAFLGQVDAAAQGGVDHAQLQADVAAADHQQPLGDVGQGQRGRGGHDAAGRRMRRTGEGHGTGAGGDNGMAEANAADFTALQARGMRIFELGARAEELDIAPAAQEGQVFGQVGDHTGPPLVHGLQVDAGAFEGDPHFPDIYGIAHHLGEKEQAFGGDAAFEEAAPARLGVGIDHGYLQPQVGRAKRRGIAGRTTADDQHFAFLFQVPHYHVALPLCLTIRSWSSAALPDLRGHR